jgi:hypothetical protein
MEQSRKTDVPPKGIKFLNSRDARGFLFLEFLHPPFPFGNFWLRGAYKIQIKSAAFDGP